MSNAPPAPVRIKQAKSSTWLGRLRHPAPPPNAPAVQSEPAADGEAITGELNATGVINLQVWMDQAPWRPAGLWAFVAGLLASGALRQLDDLNWQALALLALLVDPLWGGLWRLAGGRDSLLTLPPQQQTASRFGLPYMQDGSPAARLLRGDQTDIWPAALRIGLPAGLLALGAASLLGVYALGLTALVIVLAAMGWTLRRTFGDPTFVLPSIVAVGLPWVLTVQTAGQDAGQAAQQVDAMTWLPQLLLAGLWVLHQWGGLRNAGMTDWPGLLLMAAAQIGMCSLLIAAQTPLWLAPLALLLLPTWLLAYQQQPLRRLRFLWLAAMLVSALALGQTAGV